MQGDMQRSAATGEFAKEQGAGGRQAVATQAQFGAVFISNQLIPANRFATTHGLDRRPRMSFQKFVEKTLIERRGIQIRSAGAPPGWSRFSVVETHAPKEPGIAKDKGAFRLMENEVVVLFRSKPRRFDSQLSRHSEVDADPAPNFFASPDYFGVAAGEFEHHLFAPRGRAQKTASRQRPNDFSRIRSTKDSLPGVKLNTEDFSPQTGVPLAAIILDLSELRHSAK